MARGDLAVVEDWLAAVDAGDAARLTALTAAEVELVGPRGAVRADRSVLAGWLARAGFSAESRRWFCGGDRWVDVASGQEQGRARIASQFLVDPVGRLVVRYVRHDAGTAAALAAAGLSARDEVTVRS
ncbi:hypothetical protein [Modestobacter sp. URMC 112]